MSAVIADIIEGSIQLSGSGWEDERIYLVRVDPGPNPAARKFEAATHPDVPRRGDSHPGGVPGCTVQSVTATPESNDPETFRITVKYGGDTDGTAAALEGTGIKGLDLSTSTITKTTRTDRDGNLLWVSYQGPSFQVRATSAEPAQDVVVLGTSGVLQAEFEVSLLRATVTVERPLPGLSEHVRCKDRTNVLPWSGEPAGTWLCLGVDSSVGQNGNHDWRYQLAHLHDLTEDPPKTWLFRAEINQVSGVLPADVSEGNGYKHFPMYRTLDFGSLGFEIPR